MHLREWRKAFTLVELLVVIGITGVLSGLLLPAVQKVREAALRTSCSNNLKQIGIACLQYHDNNRSFPAGYAASGKFVDGAFDTTPGWGWAAFLLPHLEQHEVHQQVDFTLPVEHIQNAAAIKTVIATFLCPSDVLPPGPFAVPDGFGSALAFASPTSYAACVGGDETDSSTGVSDDGLGRGVFYRNSQTRIAHITDGTSSTILVGERSWSNVNAAWAGAISGAVAKRGQLNPCPGSSSSAYPAATLVQAHSHLNNTDTDTDGGLDDFSSRHLNGSNFLFADGAVHFIRSITSDLGVDVDGKTIYRPESLAFQALGTRANNDCPTGLDF